MVSKTFTYFAKRNFRLFLLLFLVFTFIRIKSNQTLFFSVCLDLDLLKCFKSRFLQVIIIWSFSTWLKQKDFLWHSCNLSSKPMAGSEEQNLWSLLYCEEQKQMKEVHLHKYLKYILF